tara:strand:- start:1429 stop:1590 length:162 start_codon:yes stop_codon:yes gene_type:complete
MLLGCNGAEDGITSAVLRTPAVAVVVAGMPGFKGGAVAVTSVCERIDEQSEEH